MSSQKLSDLTIDDLKQLIKDLIAESIIEIIGDPDANLEIHEDVKNRLQRSLRDLATMQTTPAQAVASKLGLKW